MDNSIIEACEQGNIEALKELISQDSSHLAHPLLHIAARNGHVNIVRYLLRHGFPWNSLDSKGNTAGEDATPECYEELVNEGVRAEMVLGLLARKEETESEDEGEEKKHIVNADYLSQTLLYKDEKLIDEEGNGVMMGWEEPLMKRHADIICPKEGLTVLNIGFGLGIIDKELQKRRPANHVIVEAHPDVYKYMLSNGWDKKPGVKILFGRWQEKIGEIAQFCYDGIFFDTFGEHYQDMREWHEHVPNILAPNGTYSFFNGLGGDHQLFNSVYCRIVEIELGSMGLETTYEPVEIDVDDPRIWDGIKRQYWQLKKYHLPICRFID
ncbi:uncharacterized protein VTP21DRAFT_10434 [Calcarisporiella thermophila]|uniref:uncharacterized protein n=1 Tax=Calcarisporiella thermophila TaxID=911321 RepID=UPI0037443584